MKKIVIAIIASLSIGAFATLPAFAGGTCPDGSSYVSSEAECGYNQASGGKTGTDLPNSVKSIINGAIMLSGLVAVVYIVVCAINIMTANGDAAKVQTARKGIIYASIGLAVCVLAYAIVNFVINDIL